MFGPSFFVKPAAKHLSKVSICSNHQGLVVLSSLLFLLKLRCSWHEFLITRQLHFDLSVTKEILSEAEGCPAARVSPAKKLYHLPKYSGKKSKCLKTTSDSKKVIHVDHASLSTMTPTKLCLSGKGAEPIHLDLSHLGTEVQ